MSDTTYVYEGTEVRKTGRVAVRELKSIGNKPGKKQIQHEITPIGDDDGWKKWVDEAQLFEVQSVQNGKVVE